MTMSEMVSISIILPTLNEEESLKVLVPDITKVLRDEDYEVIIVDDSSTDGTTELVSRFVLTGMNVRLISRSSEKSLPNSIYEGIEKATKDYVMWLDSDGSMDAISVKKLVDEIKLEKNAVLIGSRFAEGGGYKGKQRNLDSDFTSFFSNIINSEDSFLAIFLSLVFNKVLSFLLPINIKDLTSGFIIGKKDYFTKQMFSGFFYGEYFINVVTNLHLSDIYLREVGYICKPRIHGESKTSTNLFRLLSLSKPYLKTAINCRKKLYENI